MAACSALASSSIAAKVASVTAPSTVISCSWMIAARLSSLITPLAYWSNGDMAESTSSIFSNASVASLICRLFSASRTLEPSGTTTTTCAVTPPAWGKVRFSESSAACDSVPGHGERLVELAAERPGRPRGRPRARPTRSAAPGRDAGRRPARARTGRKTRGATALRSELDTDLYPIQYCIDPNHRELARKGRHREHRGHDRADDHRPPGPDPRAADGRGPDRLRRAQRRGGQRRGDLRGGRLHPRRLLLQLLRPLRAGAGDDPAEHPAPVRRRPAGHRHHEGGRGQGHRRAGVDRHVGPDRLRRRPRQRPTRT